MDNHSHLLKKGYFLYAGSRRLAVEILPVDVIYGSGDDQDPPEIQEDRTGNFFLLRIETIPLKYQSGVSYAEMGRYESLAEAIKEAEAKCVGLQWDE